MIQKKIEFPESRIPEDPATLLPTLQSKNQLGH
jgi:hypothetical protein